MIIDVSSLRESRYYALIRLSKVSRLQMINTNLDYQVESYISLKQLIEPNIINQFALGQLSVLVFNIIVHLIKVYSKIQLSKLTFENIIFNQELQVKFINLHEEDNLQTYQQNLQIIIVLMEQLFLKFQEAIIELYKDSKEISICQKIELATFYSNKILTLLQSNRHLKKLKLFVKNSVDKGIIKDNLFEDNLTVEKVFRNIFSKSLLSNNSLRNTEQASQQLKCPQQQNRVQSNQSGSSQQEYSPYNQQQSSAIDESSTQFQQSNVIEKSQSLQNNQFQQQQYFKPQQILITDQFQQEPQNLVQLDPEIPEQNQNYVSQHSQLQGKTINPQLYAFYAQNISYINNEDFKTNLLGLLSKNYKESNETQAAYICQAACYYFNYLSQYCQHIQNQNQMDQNQINQFFQNGLELLIQLFNDDRLLEMVLQDGLNICLAKLEQLKDHSLNQY